MYQWEKQVPVIINGIDGCIKAPGDEALALKRLARRLGYLEAARA